MSWRSFAVVVLVAWGVLSFGAVYPWAYQPLFIGAGLVGVATLFTAGRREEGEGVLVAALVLVAVAIGVQLVPVSRDVMLRVSPEAESFLLRAFVPFAVAAADHPLSVAPVATWLALGAMLAFSATLIGLGRALTREDVAGFIRWLAGLGVVVAFVGMAQKAMWNGKIYGVWKSLEGGDSYGPFVNKNHFAGWMLMATPVVLGYFLGRMTRGARNLKPGFRHRLAWLETAEASEVTLTGLAVIPMALSLILTMSRSGMTGLVVALLFIGWHVIRSRAIGSGRRSIGLVYLVFAAALTASWVGLDQIANRFGSADSGSFGGRLPMWVDVWAVAQKFPLVGTGMNTLGHVMYVYQTYMPEQHIREAHNDYLQLLTEGGLLVAIPAALALLAFIWTTRRRFTVVEPGSTDYWVRIGAVAGLLGIGVQEISDFSLQMPGNAMLFTVLLALCVRQPSPFRRAGNSPSIR